MICSTRAVRLAALTLALVFGSAAVAAQAQSPLASLHVPAQANRVPANPDFGPQTQLTGHLPGWVNVSNQVSTQSDDLGAPAHVTIVLARDPAVQAAFEQFLAAQQSPGNALYHQWLTPQQVGSLFGPTASDLAAVTSWLTSQGLTVESVAPNQVMLEVSGTDASIGNAFRTTFGYFNLNGTPRRSAVSEPSIPTALAPVVKVIYGLTDIPINPLSHFQPVPAPSASTPVTAPGVRPDYTSSKGNHYLFPNDFATIYDINSVYSGGNTGGASGTGARAGHVAIIGRSRVAATDISEWASIAAVTGYTLNTIIPTNGTDPGATCTVANANTCSTGGDQGEQTLDVDRVVGTVPGAQTDLVVSLSSRTQDGVYIAASYNVNTLLDPVMTISYGSCELNSSVSVWDTLFSAGAAEGISTFVSSGDSGANGCASSFTATSVSNTASPNSICSSSYDTCVGGTEFADTTGTYWSTTNGAGDESALSYIPEGGWNEPTGCNTGSNFCPSGSGGGPSTIIAKPSWQTGTGVLADGSRDTPDIAYPAASHDGYYACLDYATGSAANTCPAGYAFVFSGTSAAAPAMAGVAALLNTKLAGSKGLGNLNPLLYSLAASHPSVFHDVTVASSGVSGCSIATPSMCNNSTPGAASNSATIAGGVQGYLVGAGYDMVTGLGSIDVANLLANAVVTTFTVTPATTTYNLISGATTGNTDVITFASLNSFAGTVNYTCAVTNGSGTAAGSCSLSPTSGTLVSAGTSTSSLTITTTPGTSGVLNVTVTGTSGATVVTSSTITVNLTASSFTMSANPNTLTVAAGATSGNTSLVTFTSVNGFAGTISVGCTTTLVSGSASGTCAALPSSVTLAANGTGNSTVTLTSTAGAGGVLTENITGSGAPTGGTIAATASTTVTATLTVPTFTVTPATTSYSLISGATSGNTDVITFASQNSFAGTINYTCTVTNASQTAAGSCSLSPTSGTLTSGGTATSTLTINTTIGTIGTLNVKVTGTSGTTVVNSSTISVVVIPPSYTLSTPAAINVVSGVTTGNTSTINVVSFNGFAGTVTFTCAVTNTLGGSTSGVSCAASPVTLTANGNSNSTLTLTSPAGAYGTFLLTINATGTTTGSTIPWTGTASGAATLTAATFSLSATPVTITSGATTLNTSTITVTSAAVTGFTGAVTFSPTTSCVISGSGYYPPSCTISPSSVNVTAGGTSTATATITSTTAQEHMTLAGFGGWGVRGGVLAAVLLGLLPFRRRRVFRPLAAFAVLAMGFAALSGCGGGGTAPVVKHSSAGTYVVTVTGTSTTNGFTNTVQTTFPLQIN